VSRGGSVWMRLCWLLAVATAIGTASIWGAGMPVLTRAYNDARTGANTSESALTPDRVAHGMRRLFSLFVLDDPRIEAEPLYVPGLQMGDGRIHDVVYVATMGNQLWAFDANSGHPIWPEPTSLGQPFFPRQTSNPDQHRSTENDVWGINIRWGILSTPVIDIDQHLMYIVNWMDHKHHEALFLHAMDIRTGREIGKPKPLAASALGPNGQQIKMGADQKQRAALLLVPLGNSRQAHVPKKLIVAISGGEHPGDPHGWLLAFDVPSLHGSGTWISTPRSFGGGIWQAGEGPSADEQGHIYAMTGNGGFTLDQHHKVDHDFVGSTDFPESFVKLGFPSDSLGSPRLELLDWFSPFRDSARTHTGPYDYQDQDLGSAGPVVPPGTDLLLGAGKDGVLYVLDRNHLGRAVGDFSVLKGPPAFLTYEGAAVAASGDLDLASPSKTHHLHGSPIYWASPDRGPMLYAWGENESLRAWHLDTRSGRITLIGRSAEVASAALACASCPGMGGMPGGMLTLSANAHQPHSGIVWATAPIDGDANREVVEGVLRAYDATQLDTAQNTDGSARLKLLWSSAQLPHEHFYFAKFAGPVVADGKVFVPTYSGRVDVYAPR
jgi:hypothetical protein